MQRVGNLQGQGGESVAGWGKAWSAVSIRMAGIQTLSCDRFNLSHRKFKIRLHPSSLSLPSSSLTTFLPSCLPSFCSSFLPSVFVEYFLPTSAITALLQLHPLVSKTNKHPIKVIGKGRAHRSSQKEPCCVSSQFEKDISGEPWPFFLFSSGDKPGGHNFFSH